MGKIQKEHYPFEAKQFKKNSEKPITYYLLPVLGKTIQEKTGVCPSCPSRKFFSQGPSIKSTQSIRQPGPKKMKNENLRMKNGL
jgi:hypothetical protein